MLAIYTEDDLLKTVESDIHFSKTMRLPSILLLTLGVTTAAPLEPIQSTEPQLQIDPVEIGETIIITGVVPGDSFFKPNSPVTVSIEGTAFTAAVVDDGAWSIVIPSSFVQSLPEGIITVAASAVDAAGNMVTGTSSVLNNHLISL